MNQKLKLLQTAMIAQARTESTFPFTNKEFKKRKAKLKLARLSRKKNRK